jgi:hypothetical protein
MVVSLLYFKDSASFCIWESLSIPKIAALPLLPI